MLTTDFDIVFDVIKKRKRILLDTLEGALKEYRVTKSDLEKYIEIFTNVGVVEVEYSALGGGDRVIFLNPRLERSLTVKKDYVKDGKLLDEYPVTLEHAKAKVEIFKVKGELSPIYNLSTLEINEGTSWFLEYVSKQIPGLINVADSGVGRSNNLKRQIAVSIKRVIDRSMPKDGEEKKNILSNILMHELVGFGVADFMLEDKNLEEIVFHGTESPITVYHKKYGWVRSNAYFEKEEYIRNIAESIGRRVGRTIDISNPVLDAHMPTGERISATLPPISDRGTTITIRKFRKNPWTIVHFISPENKTLNKHAAALLWLCVQYELNILVAGGTGSGKTSILNAISQLFPVNQHIITIEEIRELTLPKYFNWNWIPLVERKSVGGRGEVPILDLVVASLRMRPDRIIVGEVRRAKESEVMFEAMKTGHSVYGTMHADNARQVYRRLTSPPFSIQAIDLESLDLIVVQRRDRRTGLRRTYEIAEVNTQEIGKEHGNPVSILYKWDAKEDELFPVNKSKKVFDELNFYTGMNEEEINNDLKDKEEILAWMIKNKIKDVDDVGRIVSMYYEDPDFVLNFVRKEGKPEKILED